MSNAGLSERPNVRVRLPTAATTWPARTNTLSRAFEQQPPLSVSARGPLAPNPSASQSQVQAANAQVSKVILAEKITSSFRLRFERDAQQGSRSGVSDAPANIVAKQINAGRASRSLLASLAEIAESGNIEMLVRVPIWAYYESRELPLTYSGLYAGRHCGAQLKFIEPNGESKVLEYPVFTLHADPRIASTPRSRAQAYGSPDIVDDSGTVRHDANEQLPMVTRLLRTIGTVHHPTPERPISQDGISQMDVQACLAALSLKVDSLFGPAWYGDEFMSIDREQNGYERQQTICLYRPSSPDFSRYIQQTYSGSDFQQVIREALSDEDYWRAARQAMDRRNITEAIVARNTFIDSRPPPSFTPVDLRGGNAYYCFMREISGITPLFEIDVAVVSGHVYGPRRAAQHLNPDGTNILTIGGKVLDYVTDHAPSGTAFMGATSGQQHRAAREGIEITVSRNRACARLTVVHSASGERRVVDGLGLWYFSDTQAIDGIFSAAIKLGVHDWMRRVNEANEIGHAAIAGDNTVAEENHIIAEGNAFAEPFAVITEADDTIAQVVATFADADAIPAEVEGVKETTLAERESTIAESEAAIAEPHASVAQREVAITEREASISRREAAIAEREAFIAQREAAIAEREAFIAQREATLAEREADLAQREAIVVERHVTVAEQPVSDFSRHQGIPPRMPAIDRNTAFFLSPGTRISDRNAAEASLSRSAMLSGGSPAADAWLCSLREESLAIAAGRHSNTTHQPTSSWQ